MHTGLGKSGEDSLLVDLAPDHENFLKLQAQSFGDRIMSLEPKAGIAYRIRGGMQKGVEHVFSGINWTAITQEFGTIPSINVMEALRAENSWTHYSNREGIDLLNHWSKNNLLAAFRPDNDIWENKIIERVRQKAPDLQISQMMVKLYKYYIIPKTKVKQLNYLQSV